jgi:hypothetical protein
MKQIAMVLLVVVAWACACSRQDTQKTLARRLSEADRAIASYDMGGGFKASMPLTTEETKKLIEAVENGERIHGSVEATPDMPIQFYKGTNLMGILRSGGGGKVFWTDDAVYKEATGTLESFFWRVRTQAASATPAP